MTPETMERLIRMVFEELEPGGVASFAFQDGEPTLAGLPFFQNFVATVAELRKAQTEVLYAIQTNGMSIDEKWAAFFSKHRFLVGISIDGSKDIHDLHRIDGNGKGSWNRVVRSWQILRRYQVDTNILCVVSNACSRSPQKVYDALKKLGARYLQFIPCLDPLEEPRGSYPYSLSPDRYQMFLCGLFDVWYQDWKEGNYVSIRLFDDYVHLFMGIPAGTCATSGQCGSYFVVEGDGILYPCDFYVLDEWRLGSVHEGRSFFELSSEKLTKKFQQRSYHKPTECESCQWQRLCYGGCPRDWYTLGPEVHNYFCSAFQGFFSYVVPRLKEMATTEMEIRRRTEIYEHR